MPERCARQSKVRRGLTPSHITYQPISPRLALAIPATACLSTTQYVRGNSLHRVDSKDVGGAILVRRSKCGRSYGCGAPPPTFSLSHGTCLALASFLPL